MPPKEIADLKKNNMVNNINFSKEIPKSILIYQKQPQKTNHMY